MKTKYLLRLLMLLPIIYAGSLQAQMVDCNVFLKGRYVEAGINWNGAYGSTINAPAGYHPNIGFSTLPIYNSAACDSAISVLTAPLGFAADPGMDGWEKAPIMALHFYSYISKPNKTITIL